MKQFLYFFLYLIVAQSILAQAPQKMSYQAIIRNTTNQLVVNQVVGMRISIIQGSQNGTAVYSETHSQTTNENGLLSLEVGTGTVQTGTFSTINWVNGPYFIKTETDPLGGTNYTITGSSQLLSVPYAFYAENSGSSTPGPRGPQGNPGIIANGTATGNTTYWDGSKWVLNSSNIFNNGSNIGIGTATPHPSAKLDVTSTTQGFLPPRMTTAQRNAIINPAEGLIIYNITTSCLNIRSSNVWNTFCGSIDGSISSLGCNTATLFGTFKKNQTVNNCYIILPYKGGNGGSYQGFTVNSSGVNGLKATIVPGYFGVGDGTLTLNISGTPNSSGIASFNISIGGQSCLLSTINVLPLDFECGVSTVTFNYKGSTVTYGTIFNDTTKRCWLDRNLGAQQVPTSTVHQVGFGDLFQWGRGDDGHQSRNSALSFDISSSDTPGHNKFIIDTSGQHFNWRIPLNPNAWQGVNGINNPCPTGFRVPTKTEFLQEINSWEIENMNGGFNSKISKLKFTLNGYRAPGNITGLSAGEIYYTPTIGHYWTSTVSPTSEINKDFIYRSEYVSIDGSGVASSSSLRSSGRAIRCIKD
jgi:uncharacterized protein (TIGR02145 family)